MPPDDAWPPPAHARPVPSRRSSMTGPLPSAAPPAGPSATVHVVLGIPVDRAGRIAVSVAVAGHLERTEELSVVGPDGSPVAHHELVFDRGTRLHVLDAPVGDVTVSYDATVSVTPRQPEPVTEAEALL